MYSGGDGAGRGVGGGRGRGGVGGGRGRGGGRGGRWEYPGGQGPPPPRQAYPPGPAPMGPHQTYPSPSVHSAAPAAPPSMASSSSSTLTAGMSRLAIHDSVPTAAAPTARDPSPSSSAAPPAPMAVAPAPAAAAPTPNPAPAPRVLAPLSSKALKPPSRPGFGTAGQKYMVTANHFRVDLLKDLQIYHYDITITPEVTSAGVNRAVIKQLVQQYGLTHLANRVIAYDGRKNAYTTATLPFESKEFVIDLAEKDGKPARRERKFTIVVRLAAKIDLEHLQQFLAGRLRDAPYEIIQVLDVVLRETPSSRHVTVGRSFFLHEERGHKPLGGGVENWRGYYQSLRPTQMGLSLNVDLSATAFYEPKRVIDFVSDCLNLKGVTRPLTDTERSKIKKLLRGVKVETVHQSGKSREYRVTGVSSLPANQLMFEDKSGHKMSVAGYFKEKYNYQIKLTSWPCLTSGSANKPTQLPMEVCKIVAGQKYSKKLNENQVMQMLKETCQRPSDRQRNIAETMKANNYAGDGLVREFGLRINTGLTSIEARLLPPPELKYSEQSREPFCCPSLGQWNMINKRVLKGVKIDNWACLNLCDRAANIVWQFLRDLTDMCSNMGTTFSPRPVIDIYHMRRGETEEAALVNVHRLCSSHLGQAKQLQLLIIILPDVSGSLVYGKIKKVCETELGIVSQCIHPRKICYKPASKQYLGNVALKINVKAGGSNNAVSNYTVINCPYVTDKPTIIFGADVTHPSPGEDSSPSIAAVVASMDWPGVTQYKGLISAQTHRAEIISDLYVEPDPNVKNSKPAGMIRELLISFYRNNKQCKPKRIIFYRDGVSEGQFQHVLLHEMDAIRKACMTMEDDYRPSVTFVVVQKRHHTRIFAADTRDRNATDKSGNILPGTVVDNTICHPTEFDFYLCSHSGIQGTSRPAHYHVLYDENGFTADALQTLTNNLCYTYARCTRSVSVVPPAYYAHLAAFRGRFYMNDASDSASSVGRGREEPAEPAPEGSSRPAAVTPLPQVKENVKEVMFYC